MGRQPAASLTTLEVDPVYELFPVGQRILGILTYGETALTGERAYADEELLKIMFAPLGDEMELIGGA
ncbi:MAG: hypothetical protein RJQ10_03690 [Haliea sp.]|uniref:hypothetical protein n=1 Tax=Haliea sp. TaxID=1932666 RepID=UPI0032EE6DFA